MRLLRSGRGLVPVVVGAPLLAVAVLAAVVQCDVSRAVQRSRQAGDEVPPAVAPRDVSPAPDSTRDTRPPEPRP